MEQDDADDVPSSLPVLWPYLIGCALVALWVAFGTIHRDQHSDSILNVLISLQRWTPFVWEQDRFGMLVPLLAWPFRNPLANMVVQAFLSSFAGLFTLFILARYAIRDASYPVIGTLGAASLLALTPPYYRFEYLVDTSYGISLSLSLWGLILVEPGFRGGSWRNWIGPLLLMVVAHWVNSATALFLGPFVLFRSLLGAWPPSEWPVMILGYSPLPFRNRLEILARGLWRLEIVRVLVLLAAGYASGQVMISLCEYQPTDLSALRSEEWPRAWWELLRVNWIALEPPLWAGLLALEAGLGIIGLARRPWGRSADVARSAAAMLATAVVLWLLMGTRSWVKINEYSFRYLFPSTLLAQTAVGALAVAALGVTVPSRPKGRRAFAAVATVVLLAAGTWSYGLPSLAGVRRDIDRKFGAFTDDILAARCTCFAGDYWLVWPAVFHVNLVLHERGEPQPFWGLTFRCQPTYRLWKDTPVESWLAAVPRGDGKEDVYLRSYIYRNDLREVEVRRTIRVLKPIPR